jgi:hypothetical protein
MLSSCTFVSIEKSGLVETHIYPGLAVITIEDSINNVNINSKGVGAYFVDGDIQVGYFHDQRVYINDFSKCLTVYFDDHINVCTKSTYAESK